MDADLGTVLLRTGKRCGPSRGQTARTPACSLYSLQYHLSELLLLELQPSALVGLVITPSTCRRGTSCNQV